MIILLMGKQIKKVSFIVLICLLLMSVSLVLTCERALAAQSIPEGYKLVSESENIALYINTEIGAIAVEDKRNGYLWKSIVDKEVYPAYDTANAQWKNYMVSLLVLNYVDLTKKDIVIAKSYSSSDAKNPKVSKSSKGVSIEYSFTQAGINITLEFAIEDDSLVIKIPSDKIKENEGRGLVSLELMPFFGAADRNVDGYLFYPDGSGAITKYANVDQRPKDIKAFTWDIYGPEQINLEDYALMKSDEKNRAMLPVMGVKNGDNAMLSAITTGMEDSKVKVYPDGYVVNLNRVNFDFTYRHSYSINLSNIVVHGKNTAKTPVATRVDKQIIKQDREVRVFFLNGKNANYSGMAIAYRNYLEKNNQIKKVIKIGDSIPMGLDLFMGIIEDRMLFDKFITMTTFDNAKTISDEFLKRGVNNIQIMLKGWTKNGYGLYPSLWPPDRRLGGSSGLDKLSQYINENNIKMFLQSNFTEGDNKNGGFSTKKDVVYNGSNLPITDSKKTSFLMNPRSVIEKVKEFFTSISTFKGGLAFDNIGRYIYHDYNKLNPATRAQTAKSWQDVLAATSENNRLIAVDSGNSYVLKYADRLYGIPMTSSDYLITDEEVPFFQMVVHGSIPYTSEPGNLSYDLTKHVLKWVEYGCMPYFELTYQKSVNLKNTQYSRLFTSHYSEWNDIASRIYSDFNKRLSSIWSEKITSHEKLSKDLYKMKYSNDTTIYINYSEKNIQVDGYSIKPQDYLVVDKGGATK